MEILRTIKNNQAITSTFATLLISSLEIQLLCMFIIKINVSIYGKVFQFLTFNHSLPPLVIINLSLNFTQVAFLLINKFITKPNQNKTKSVSKSGFIRSLQIKHYITFVQIININSLAIKQETNLIKAFALFNILFVFSELYALKIISISYRFVEKNFLRRRNSSIIPWALIIPIIVSMNYLPIVYSCLFLLLRALIQLYNNFKDLENETIRKLEWFYPLMSAFVAIIIFVDYLTALGLFSSKVFSTFIIVLSVFCCQDLTKTVDLQVLKFYLQKSAQFFENEDELQDSGDSENSQIDESQVNQNILQIRMMVNIFVSRSEYKSTKNLPPSSSPFHFDHWWTFFNQFVMNHKVYCKKVNCVCQGLAFCKYVQNSAIEDQVFAEKIYDLIKKIQTQSSESTAKKLKIIENYFLVEIEKKPFKGYYQLVKLFSNSLTKSETLEIETLMMETRDRFKMIFMKEKVRNSNLQLEPVFQLQAKIKEMRLQMNQMAMDYREFYEIFANNFVEMESLKSKAKLLSKHKTDFSKKFDYCLEKFNKSFNLVTLAMVYFKFFDEYTDQLNLVEKRAGSLYQSYFSPSNTYKNKGVDVFDPHYGSVKIDLVFKLGKVLSISKNLCHALGFSHRQIEGHKVNKLMPYMFAKVHDRFLKNFIQKGSLKILKEKEAIYYSKNAKKFMVPITIKLKVDFSQFDNLCAMAFIKPTPTKSEFIIMNNYGKIQQISQGLYKKLFTKTCIDQMSKIKKLSMSKMMLSLNYYLKDTKQKDEEIHEGLLLTGQSEEVLVDYYRLPEFGISAKKGQFSSGKSSSRSGFSQSMEASSSLSSRHSSLDFSQDMNQYTLGMKESLKEYLKKLDTSKVIGYRVTYRLKDLVTSEFKCKVLQIVSIWQEVSKSDFSTSLRTEIIDIAEFFNLEQQEYQRFRELAIIQAKPKDPQSTFPKQKLAQHETIQSQKEQNQQQQVKHFQGIQIQESQGSSVCSLTQVEKQKQNVISAFSSKIVVSSNLQTGLNILILCTALLLILISVFSIVLKNNYIELQHDNLIITNFRINFLSNLGIYELEKFYQTLQINPPQFLQQKKAELDLKTKQCLKKSTQWISISKQDYSIELTLNYADKKYSQRRSILKAIMISYSTLLSDPKRSKYITQNHANYINNFLTLTNNQEKLITEKSLSYKKQIDIVVSLYGLVMTVIAVICVFLKRISNEKENKIIDFLPFFKSHQARKKVRFFDLLFEFNKESQNIDVNIVTEIAQNAKEKDFIKQGALHRFERRNRKRQSKNQMSQTHDTNSKLIRVAKNQKGELTPKIKLIGVLVFLLCIFVIFFSEFFFSETHSKFDAYLQLKNSAFLVQLIPARIILLYFININRALQDDQPIASPTGFTGLVHDRIFQLQMNLSSQNYYGLEMEQIVRDHFSRDICKLIQCHYDPQESSNVHNQQLFYLAYRIVNAFDYMRDIKDQLPNFPNPKVQIEKWMRENNMYQILKSTEFILDLMKKNEEEITNLFTNQIVNIGQILLGISVTLIPILIFSLLFAKSMYMETISNKLQSTENVYKHIGWEMLGQNTYAVNYFEEKLKMSKTY